MRAIHYYMAGTSTWFLSFGMQTVMFAWLVTMVLEETPENVGAAQMALLLPGTLFMLLGGTLADHFGGRRLLMLWQGFAVVPLVLLLVVISTGVLSYRTMIGYAVLMGLAQAFVNPSRDGLLNQVAEGKVQRAVMLTSLMQFGGQIMGFVIASMADVVGPRVIVGTQAVVMSLGVFMFSRVRLPEVVRTPRRGSMAGTLWGSVKEGAVTVWGSRPMRMVMVQNMAMAMFFMGSYMVTLPILVREVYDGTASDLAWMNAANSIGLVSTIFLLLKLGDIERRGRALILAQGTGCFLLATPGFVTSFAVLVGFLYLWGAAGGIAMSMSRTIMQEQAPDGQRGRVMAFFGLSFMGFGPLGALLSGFLADWLGPQIALATSSGAMFVVIVLVSTISRLWWVAGHVVPGDAAEAR